MVVGPLVTLTVVGAALLTLGVTRLVVAAPDTVGFRGVVDRTARLAGASGRLAVGAGGGSASLAGLARGLLGGRGGGRRVARLGAGAGGQAEPGGDDEE